MTDVRSQPCELTANDESELPPAYRLLRVTAPDKLRISQLRAPSGDAWQTNLGLTRRIGDTWLKSQRSALARVPSAILPNTFNYLLNPLHPDAVRITIAEARSTTMDPRLIR